MDLSTTYMGLTLSSPLIASAAPRNDDLGHLRALEDAGAGAVVLPSVFAEQIEAEEARHLALTQVGALSSPEAASYFPAGQDYHLTPHRTLDLVRRARLALSIPVIASLNAADLAGWTDYAAQLQAAGASALELNIYAVPADLTRSGRDVEQTTLDIVRAVRAQVTLPIAVKISPYFSAPGHMATQIVAAGADALVLFNRFYQPDIDVVTLSLRNDLDYSRSADMRLPLLWIALLHGQTTASLAATTGVHQVEDVVKYLAAGADGVMTTSALLEHGVGRMRLLVDGLADWLTRRDMPLAHLRGLLARGNLANPAAYARANYIKILQGHELRPV